MHFAALRYFLETARLGSIRQASETLHVAPSAISRQIALLETDFGMPLFERHAAGVRLTQAGEVFARQAHATIRDFERLHSEIDDLQQLKRGLVRIASVWATVEAVVHPAIVAFSREYPGITYDVHVVGGMRAVSAVAAEECDIAIGFEPAPHRDIELVGAIRDPIVAVMHPDHPLASRAKVTLRELSEHPVALPDDTTVTRTLIDEALAREDLAFRTVVTFEGIGFVPDLVKSGLFVSFAPGLVSRADVAAGRLRAALIDFPTLLSTRFVLCRHRSRPPSLPAEAFIGALQRRFTELDAEMHGGPQEAVA